MLAHLRILLLSGVLLSGTSSLAIADSVKVGL